MASQIVARDRFKIDIDARLDPTVLATGNEGVSNFTDAIQLRDRASALHLAAEVAE